MVSTLLMKVLLVEYIILFFVCLCEHNFPKSLYWAGAAILTVSILWGMK